MRPGRSPRAGRTTRRLVAIASALPTRIGVVFVLAALPLLILLGFWAPHERSFGIGFDATVLGVGIAVVGIDYVVARPLRSLGLGLDQWRAGKSFNLAALGPLSPEFREVALSFKRFMLALRRRETELEKAKQFQQLAMQEIHHRVKNNLQIVASLLNLQASRIREPGAQFEFQSARDRIRALATVHRHLYAHGELNLVNLRLFLGDLCRPLFQAMGEVPDERIALVIEAPELQMTSDQAVPLSLIVTEAVTNAIRYAFPDGRTGTISILLHGDGDDVVLTLADDGVGIHNSRAAADEDVRGGIGLQLIRGFVRQLGAELKTEDGVGTRYVIRMKLRRERLSGPMLNTA